MSSFNWSNLGRMLGAAERAAAHYRNAPGEARDRERRGELARAIEDNADAIASLHSRLDACEAKLGLHPGAYRVGDGHEGGSTDGEG